MTHPWNERITSLPGPHLLQTWEWGQVKSRFGWQPYPLFWDEAGARIFQTTADNPNDIRAAALLLVRTIPIRGFAARVSVAYVPKGPLLDWEDAPLRARVLADLRTFARKKAAIFLKIDPDVRLGTGVPGTPEAAQNPFGHAFAQELQQSGWLFSPDQIQYRNTILIDLTPSEEQLLAQMKQKTRYNVRLAARKGVTVRTGTQHDLDTLFRMYAETSRRDGFAIRERGYYITLWRTFLQAGMLDPLIAEVAGEPVAALMLFRFAGKAWYLNGMSLPIHRDKMPNYLLQWEAMRRAKAAGCRVYDLWGAPDKFDESDSMWGVYRFKRGFGGQVVRHIGAWDYPLRPAYYRLYTHILPRVLEFLKARRG